MNTFKQSLWLCLIIIGLAYGGWYFIRPAYQFKLDETSLLTLPDGYAKNLSIQQFDEKGHLNHHLQALSMQSIPQDNAHDFKMPVLTLYEDNQAPWVISAKTARAIYGGQQITLCHDVIIKQAQHATHPASLFKTTELTYFPKQKFATTDKAIMFKQPDKIVHAVGMNAQLDKKHVQLLHHTRVIFTPKP